ncbi:MAG: M42 family metallopeptidase [Planctomycetota bacterium]|jgi:endoglucanase
MDERTAFLKEITEAFGPPGLEDDVAAILRRRTEGFCEVSSDNLGSFVAGKNGTASSPRIMVAGHMDEVAFMVTDIEKEGFARIRPLGGWWPHVLLGQRVKVRTRKGEFLGVIGSKPPHELKEEERRKVLEFEDIFLDLGVSADVDVIEQTGVRRGDFVVPHAPFETLGNENLFVVKAWDNRVGCALTVDLLDALKDVPHPNTVFGVATVQEEIGLRGAVTSAEKVKPDIAFAVDVGIARDTPGFQNSGRNPEKLGGGASVLLLEGAAVSHPRLVRFVLEVAEEEGILHHTTTIAKGSTDSNRFQISGQGVPSMAICVPSRYIHSHSSIVDRRDYEAALKLLIEVVRRLDTETVSQLRTPYASSAP